MLTKQTISNFDINGVGLNNGKLFGFPFSFSECDIVVFPAPWEVTTSFGGGTSYAPNMVLEASRQLDFCDLDFGNIWHKGIYMPPVNQNWLKQSKQLAVKANELILLQEKGVELTNIQAQLNNINQACEAFNTWVFEETSKLLNQNKKVIILGGDHSTPLGYYKALANHYPSFGILQIDAHADLRNTYEGFTFSHASIFYNTLAINNITQLTQVGIRDFCEAEYQQILKSNKINTHFYTDLIQAQYKGKNWNELAVNIVNSLPQNVYLSIDVDGLDPKLCPNTGTPVPGGLDIEQLFELFREIKRQNKTVIGADLCEIGNHEWDANVGARILYKLCGLL